ncbi:MAG: Flp family type IVb pilin [Bacillota bacterium]|nr:Flp family type IVb pilin [Bacillota bacterium]
MKKYLKMIKKLSASSKGQGMVEYGLIIVLIAVVVIAALTPLGNTIAGVFTSIVNSITGAA